MRSRISPFLRRISNSHGIRLSRPAIDRHFTLCENKRSDIDEYKVPSPPDSANVVVVGGGIIGTSVAYHLARSGVEDVILLERDKVRSVDCSEQSSVLLI